MSKIKLEIIGNVKEIAALIIALQERQEEFIPTHGYKFESEETTAKEWIAEAVGKMHINKITQSQLAEKMGVTNDYIWMILNGKKSPKGIQTRVKTAINSILADRNKV